MWGLSLAPAAPTFQKQIEPKEKGWKGMEKPMQSRAPRSMWKVPDELNITLPPPQPLFIPHPLWPARGSGDTGL